MLFDQNRPISLRLAYQYSRVSPKGERLRNLLSQSIFQFATLLLLGGADFGPTDVQKNTKTATIHAFLVRFSPFFH